MYRAYILALALNALAVFGANAQSILVSTGSVWKYFDSGFEPAGWRSLSFGEGGWGMGPGQLGFGDNDEATVVRQYPSASVTNITIYFRHKFNLVDPSAYTNLLVRLRRDDGAIVYVNEVEVFRTNMPLGPVDYGTFAFSVADDDGNDFFANSVSTALLLSGENILAVEVHQANITSSDISFDLELLGNVTFHPPTVTLTGPREADSFGAADLTLNATATDTDGTIASVAFFSGANLLGTLPGSLTNSTYSFTITNVVTGTYLMSAVATDSTGLSSTSAPVNITVVPRLVPSGASWKYLDTGTDQGRAWIGSGFDDSGWSNGIAQLGYGDGDEVTLINGGPATNRFATTYFRHLFDVPNPGAVTNLVVRLLRDDGGIVYLNGTEVFRSNMPLGPVNYDTFALLVAPDDGTEFHASPINPALLVSGPNVLAVEIHQANPTSSDVSFDLELRANVPPTPPRVTLTADTNNAAFGSATNLFFYGPTNVSLTAAATDLDGPVSMVNFYDGATLIGTDVTEPFNGVASNLSFGSHVLRAIATDATGLSATSAPITLTILQLTTLIPTGAVWKYLDTGVNQGVAWREPNFDDSTWPSGTAKFGTNDPATTIIHITPINVNLTAYFRHYFSASNAANVASLAFRVLHDDGVVTYLNGTEIFRMNMGPAPVSFNTAAATAIGGTNEMYYEPTNVSSALLVEGTNVLAVELHQALNTSDAGFDLGLIAIAVSPSGVPSIHIEFTEMPTPTVILRWPGTGFVLQEAESLGGSFIDLPGATSPYALPPAGVSGFYRLKAGP
jgi:hypothetical protein